MFHLRHYDLSHINSSPLVLEKLKGIFQSTLNPDLTDDEFQSYLFGAYPDSLQVSFIHTEEELAGFCTSVAYPRRCNNKKVVIIRSAFGLNDKFKKGGFPLQGLFYKYICYKFKHLFTPVYVAGFMANPLMYAMICKYTATCYPRQNRPTPPKIIELKNAVLQSIHLTEEIAPFVTKIDFQVRFSSDDIERFSTTTNGDALWYQAINPQYRQQMGVLVIIPVTIGNMSFTLCRYVLRGLTKKVKSFFYGRRLFLTKN